MKTKTLIVLIAVALAGAGIGYWQYDEYVKQQARDEEYYRQQEIAAEQEQLRRAAEREKKLIEIHRLNALGERYFAQFPKANYEKAVAFYTQSVTHYDSITLFHDDRENQIYASVLHNLGVSHAKLQQLNKAAEYLEKSLKVHSERSRGTLLPNYSVQTLVLVYRQLGEHKKAEALLKKAKLAKKKMEAYWEADLRRYGPKP